MVAAAIAIKNRFPNTNCSMTISSLVKNNEYITKRTALTTTTDVYIGNSDLLKCFCLSFTEGFINAEPFKRVADMARKTSMAKLV